MEIKQRATEQPVSQRRNQKGDLKKYLETNKNGNTTGLNLWDAAKAILRWMFLAINAYIKKQEQEGRKAGREGRREKERKVLDSRT